MAFLIGGANSAADTGYSVANSCMFEGDDSGSYMKKDLDSGTSQKIMTISFWVKRSGLTSAVNVITDSSDNVGTTYAQIAFNTSNQLDIQFTVSSGSTARITTNRIFRDIAAWYNVCVALDTTQSTDTNRLKIYINGTQETSFATSNWPDQNIDTQWGNGSGVIWVSSEASGSSNLELDGYLAEFVYLDGTAASPTSFGEFNEDSPNIWQPINVSGLTFGNNGFYLDFEDSANLGNDKNGGTDLTEAGLAATNQATDSPTNNFAVINALDNYFQSATMSEGNLLQVSDTYSGGGDGEVSPVVSTIGVSSGKWYCELKYVSTAEHSYGRTGVTSVETVSNSDGGVIGYRSGSWGMMFNTGHLYDGDGETPASPTYHSEIHTGDIVGVYLDLDNNKLYFADNGTLVTSTGISITAAASTDLGAYFFGNSDESRNTATFAWNFGGCPAFAISSGNADANGYGNFEYDPSAGDFDGASKDFLALCTKNLAEEG